MAVNIVNVVTKNNLFVCTLNCTAAEVAAVVPHGLLNAAGVATAPDVFFFTPLLVGAYTSNYFITTVDATNINLTKVNNAEAAPTIRITAYLMGAMLKAPTAGLLKDMMDRYPAGTVPSLNQA